MKLKNTTKGLITINEPQKVNRDPETGKVLDTTPGKAHKILQGSTDWTEVPDAVCETKFATALINMGHLIAEESDDNGEDEDGNGDKSLDQMNKGELKDKAAELGLELLPDANKAAIKAAIEEHLASAE